MIRPVYYEQVTRLSLLNPVTAATCDRAIYNLIESIGGVVVIIKGQHECASNCCSEALLKPEEA